jgi:hypothetical protein
VRCPTTGKKGYPTYSGALAAHVDVNPDGLGSVYFCPDCDHYHVTRRFPQDFKRRGRRRDRIKAFRR